MGASSPFRNCTNLVTAKLKALQIVPNNLFEGCGNIMTIEIPACDQLGTSRGNNNVFNSITGQNITLKIPAALETDGDVVTLQANNTVTLILV